MLELTLAIAELTAASAMLAWAAELTVRLPTPRLAALWFCVMPMDRVSVVAAPTCSDLPVNDPSRQRHPVVRGLTDDGGDFSRLVGQRVADRGALRGAHRVVGGLRDFGLHRLENGQDFLLTALGDSEHALGVADVAQRLAEAGRRGLQGRANLPGRRVVRRAVHFLAGRQPKLVHAQVGVSPCSTRSAPSGR